MAYLVLDLDLTSIVAARTDLVHVNETVHQLSEEIQATAKDGKQTFAINIINPEELADLIQTAFTQHDGVMILTSGAWDPSLRDVLANNLNLTESVKNKLRTCLYHSVLTDMDYFEPEDENSTTEQLYEAVRHLDKNSRLEEIILNNPLLSSKYFVMLDDSPEHVASFQNNKKVEAVLATTTKYIKADKTFYEKAKVALSNAKQLEENQTTIKKNKALPGFFTESAKLNEHNKDLGRRRFQIT